jgi:hypothetical protein
MYLQQEACERRLWRPRAINGKRVFLRTRMLEQLERCSRAYLAGLGTPDFQFDENNDEVRAATS